MSLLLKFKDGNVKGSLVRKSTDSHAVETAKAAGVYI